MSSARMIAPPLRSPEERGPDDLRGSSLAESGQRTVLDHDELTIAKKLLDGDRHGAIAACARIHGAAIGRLCFLLLGAQSEADEGAQETMLAAYHAAPSYRAEGTARAWLFGIARRVCGQRLLVRDRQARRRLLIGASQLSDGPGVDASQLHDVKESEASVRAGLAALAPSDRELLALRFEGEQSFRDIADALGIDEATARKRVGRALGRLRDALAARTIHGEQP
ncbi:MAG: sigma-70 family RNA polymerase sigma factor [Polyangiales bacterium]